MDTNHYKATVIFDFDSTVINDESLEMILKTKLENAPEKQHAIAELTAKGMNGEIGFYDSLSQRMAIATPSQQDLQQFAQQHCPSAFSAGLAQLVQVLQKNEIGVWILSGGFEEAIKPFARYLGIPESQVHGVRINWDESQNFLSLNTENYFALSKLAGAEALRGYFSSPTVIVGDGYTDYVLYKEGIADYFIAYTEHVARPKVLEVADYQAASIQELSFLLKKLLRV